MLLLQLHTTEQLAYTPARSDHFGGVYVLRFTLGPVISLHAMRRQAEGSVRDDVWLNCRGYKILSFEDYDMRHGLMLCAQSVVQPTHFSCRRIPRTPWHIRSSPRKPAAGVHTGQ
jgi:hypothetical protein